MQERRIVIFEGPDRCGKSTTKAVFEKMTGYRHMCHDRSYLSSLAFDTIRNDDFENQIAFADLIAQDLKASMFNPIIFLFRPTQEFVNKNVRLTNHAPVDADFVNSAFMSAANMVSKFDCGKAKIVIVGVDGEHNQAYIAKQLIGYMEDMK